MSSPDLDQTAEALAIAVAVPAVVAGCVSLNLFLGVVIAGVSLIHALVLGLPAILVFRHFGWANPATSTVLGFSIGAIPAGLLFGGGPEIMPFACFGAASGCLFGTWLWVRARWGARRAATPPPLQR